MLTILQQQIRSQISDPRSQIPDPRSQIDIDNNVDDVSRIHASLVDIYLFRDFCSSSVHRSSDSSSRNKNKYVRNVTYCYLKVHTLIFGADSGLRIRRNIISVPGSCMFLRQSRKTGKLVDVIESAALFRKFGEYPQTLTFIQSYL
jgi:hypothetical protein